MSDRVVGDPVVLAAYTDRTLPTLDEVGDAVHQVRVAREAFERAQEAALATGYDCMAVFEPHAPEVRMGPVLELLELLDRKPAAFAYALRQLDASHRFAGPLDGTARQLSAVDDESFQQLLDTHVAAHLEASRQAGSSAAVSSTEVAALLLAGAGQAAAHDAKHLDQLVRQITERTAPGHGRTPPKGTWRRVSGSSSVLGLALSGASDLHHTAGDELATFGDRAASAATAVTFEGGGAAFGAIAGGAAGTLIPIPVAGTFIGGSVGAYLGDRAGRWARERDLIQTQEERLAGAIDALAGTDREPDRYDDLLARSPGDG